MVIFGAISVIDQSCAAPISKVEIQISDWCLYRPRAVVPLSTEPRAGKENVKLCKLMVKGGEDSFPMHILDLL